MVKKVVTVVLSLNTSFVGPTCTPWKQDESSLKDKLTRFVLHIWIVDWFLLWRSAGHTNFAAEKFTRLPPKLVYSPGLAGRHIYAPQNSFDHSTHWQVKNIFYCNFSSSTYFPSPKASTHSSSSLWLLGSPSSQLV